MINLSYGKAERRGACMGGSQLQSRYIIILSYVQPYTRCNTGTYDMHSTCRPLEFAATMNLTP